MGFADRGGGRRRAGGKLRSASPCSTVIAVVGALIGGRSSVVRIPEPGPTQAGPAGADHATATGTPASRSR